MGADDCPAFDFKGFAEGSFHFRLFGPALLVGRKPEIAAGNQVSVLGCE
jgi:hypothetical protein